jgi:hypothetical protein
MVGGLVRGYSQVSSGSVNRRCRFLARSSTHVARNKCIDARISSTHRTATLRSTSTAVKLFPGAAIELFQPCRWPVWQLYRLASCLRADEEDAA